MKLRKPIVIVMVALAAMFVAGKVLPLALEAAYPRMRASTKAFDLGNVADGAYEGKAFLLPVSVRVRATVSGSRIVSADILKHFNGQGKPAEAIVARVIEAQSLGVDTVSGATHSSLTILTAIENALTKGTKR